jgi:hypothetical protein
MTKIVVYPRGFMGFDIGLPVQTKGGGLENLITSVRLNKEIEEGRRVISNNKVEKMWTQVVNGERFTDSFDFRESIILVALHAFGTPNFLMWCRMQDSSPYLTDMHKRFLNDTFSFIQTGRRSMSLFSWQHLIVPRALTAGDATPNLEIDNFFNVRDGRVANSEWTEISHSIIKWVAQPDGFYDLLGTLHILFGDTGK